MLTDEPDLSFRYTAEEIENELGAPVNWVDPGLSVAVYIDDINNIEKTCHQNAISRITEGKRQLLAHAQKCQENFAAVKSEAATIKMTVNDSKTQLLCISGNTDNDIASYISVSYTHLTLPTILLV